MQDASRRTDGFLQYIQIALVWRNQVVATRRRHLSCKSKRISNMLIHQNPTWRRGSCAAIFDVILELILPRSLASRLSRGKSAKMASRKRMPMARANRTTAAVRS